MAREAAGAYEGDLGGPGRGKPFFVHRRGRHEHNHNSGRMSINLKPLDQRKISASNVIRRLNHRLNQVEGIQLFMEPVQDITVDDRVSRTQYQYTLEDPDASELNDWTNRFVDRLKQLPELEDVATDQQPGGLGRIPGHRPGHRVAARHRACDHR